jgi:hypothetical protein
MPVCGFDDLIVEGAMLKLICEVGAVGGKPIDKEH